MATKIVTKNSSTASAAPSASDLVQGELAVNVTDKRLYTENNAGAIVELGTNPASAVTMASTLAVGGVVTANAGVVVDNITIDGTQIDLSSGDLTLDVAGSIILDADSDGRTFFFDGGTEYGLVGKASNSLFLKSSISDGDILFQGNDGGSAITALTLDMSNAGNATFNGAVIAPNLYVGENILHADDSDTYINFTTDTIKFYTAGSSRFELASDGSLSTPTLGTSNVRFGVNAGNSIASGGNYNVVVGDEAGTAITTADYTTAIGYSAGASVTTGSYNTMFGSLAGDALTTGGTNVGIGYGAIGADTLGHASVAVGHGTLTSQNFTSTTLVYNTAVGYQAGLSVSTGVQNTLIGGLAGDALTIGNSNVSVGYNSLTTEVAGDRSVAVGYGSLALQTNASTVDVYNTAVGYQAGYAMTTGTTNTLIGALAGDAITSAANNTAVGYAALSSNCGAGNSAVGHVALVSATGVYSTALGYSAGLANTSGGNNLFLGKEAGLTGSPGGNITTASNEICLGDENISSANIQVDWTVASDQRDKTDFTALDLGLDFVNALAPVTYKWDKRSKYGDKSAEGYNLNAQTPDGTHKEDWLDIGFKAQEVEALEIAAGYNKDNNTNLVSSHTGDGKQMGLQYSKFVPILVKAIQEQNALIEALTARIETLEG